MKCVRIKRKRKYNKNNVIATKENLTKPKITASTRHNRRSEIQIANSNYLCFSYTHRN